MAFTINNTSVENITIDAYTLTPGQTITVKAISANAKAAQVAGLATITSISGDVDAIAGQAWLDNPYGSPLIVPKESINQALGETAQSAPGTVTSVAASAVAPLAVSGSPITTSGTLAFSLANTTAAAQFLAGPTGAAGAVAYRALALTDMPAGVATTASPTFTGTLTAATITASGTINSSVGFTVKEGANAKQGTATLVAGTVTVTNTSVTANSRIFLTVQSLGTVTAPKAVAVTARTAGTSFTITSSDATDTSVIAFEIFEPGS